MPQPLSPKEASLFRQVVKYFESKQNKRGLKAAEQILRKNPNHGETQAMKALLLNATGRKDEAFALAKVALKNDIKSHVCWHAYGLLWRAAKNFDEAIKAYKFALRLEPDSQQIQRDLALLQIQMRDFAGYVQSRKVMVQARPAVRQNWTALGVAYHLAGDLAAAERTLVAFEETLKIPPPKTDIEHAEAILYRNTIVAEMGETERALDHLESIMKIGLDKTAMMEMRAEYLLKLDRRKEAEKAYRDLLDRNTEYRAYYEGLEKSLGLAGTNSEARKELYGSYAQKHDRLDAARRIPLDFLIGNDFRDAADSYLRHMLKKGVPSTFNNIKALYGDEAKRHTVQDLVESYASSSQANGSAAKQAIGDHSDRFEEAVMYFLAQHYNYKLSRNLKKATELNNKLIEKFPKKYDYHMTRARIQKHSGNPVEAAKSMDHARNLDLKDRYINTKCAKYQLRNDENDVALQTMSKFTRNETVGGTLGDLVDMQVIWYLTEDGEAYRRRSMPGLALKRFHTVFDIFELWQEDQFDFHAFSFRKGQIRAYVDMIRWEDRLRDHPFYARVAIQAVETYLSLHDDPGHSMLNGASSSPDSDKKKALKKARREQERLEKEDAERIEAEKKAAVKKGNTTVDGETKKPDPDPRGAKLLETKEPLQEAMKFLTPLLEFGTRNAEAQHVGFEVFLRKKKYYLALKCILAAFSINPSDPVAHEQTIHLLHTLLSAPAESTTQLFTLTTTLLPAPYNTTTHSSPSTTLTDLNDAFMNQAPAPLPSHTFSFIRTRHFLTPATAAQNQKDLTAAALSPSAPLTSSPPSLSTALAAATVLKGLKPTTAYSLRAYVAQATMSWPDAQVALERAAGLQPSCEA